MTGAAMEKGIKIGIIGAMEVEVSSLKEKMKIERVYTAARMEFCEGKIADTEVVVVRSGIGKVNAGLCVQILADQFHVTHIINTGVAGSLNNALNIGDLVISRDAIYHDVDATVFGYHHGEVPQMGIVAFPADESMQDRALRAAASAAPEIKAMKGRVASGDQFVCDQQVKDAIKKNTGADCCEMEGCAIAQAAWLNQIPFVILRAISDKADGSQIEDYNEFEAKAARHCAAITGYMLEHFQD